MKLIYAAVLIMATASAHGQGITVGVMADSVTGAVVVPVALEGRLQALEGGLVYQHDNGTATIVATVGLLPNRVQSVSATSVGVFAAAFGVGTTAAEYGAAFGDSTAAGNFGAAFGLGTTAGIFGFSAGRSGEGADGAFVFSDSQDASFVRTNVVDGFSVRAQGGTYFETPTFEVTGGLEAESFKLDGETITSWGEAIGIENLIVISPTNDTNLARGDALKSAYAGAVYGTVLFLPEGEYDTGQMFLNKSGVTIMGTSPYTTIINGAFWVDTEASDIRFQGFTLRNSEVGVLDTFLFVAGVTNEVNAVLSDLVIEAHVAGNHILEVGGKNLIIENVRTFGFHADHGHPFVLKGVINARVFNCSSYSDVNRWANLLIVSDELVKGNTSNVFVHGFSGEGAGQGLYIDARVNARVSDVTVTDSQFARTSLHGVIIGSQALATNNLIDNFTIDALLRDTGGGVTMTSCSFLNGDVTLKGSYVAGVPLGVPSILRDDESRVQVDLKLNSPFNGQFTCNQVLQENNIMRIEAVWPLPEIAIGISSNLVRAVASTSGVVYVVLTHPLASSYLEVGDPIRIGTLSQGRGVHRLTDWGTVTVDDDPITGAVVGDMWLACDTELADGEATIDFVLPGKVHGRIAHNPASYADVAMEVTARAWPSFGSGAYSFANMYAAGRMGLAFSLFAPTVNKLHTTYVDIVPYRFRWGNEVYIGVFSGDTATTGWIGTSRMLGGTAEVYLTGGSPLLGYQKINGLPVLD